MSDVLTLTEARAVASRVSFSSPRATCVYRLFDIEGRLLYIGVTTRPLCHRFNGHSRIQVWWSEVCEVAIAWFDENHEALAAEREAIRAERPLYNKRSSAAAREPLGRVA